jgi:GT2 family glycosyltransferase
MPEPLVSVIIRTKNEERWIEPCLNMVFKQTHGNIEVVIVDNGSTDRTLDRARRYPCKVVNIDEYYPGRALNAGIRASEGSIIVCLSAHCIPVNDPWLAELIVPLRDDRVAGAYGRQEPLPFSSDEDKRDLLTVFGLDPKLQNKDPFFHNANSAFLRATWERFPFDENVTNLEDRVWGQKVISAGLRIAYTPEARVYHWHGIHQGADRNRARGVVRVLEAIHGEADLPASLSPSALRSVAVIPVRENRHDASQAKLLPLAVASAKESRFIGDVIVATDSETLAEIARQNGSLVIARPQYLSEPDVDVLDVVGFAVEQYEERKALLCDLVVLLEITYPFRPAGIVDQMISKLVDEGLDTVVAGHKEKRGLWLQHEGVVTQLGEGFKPRAKKSDAAYIGMLGLGCVTRAVALRARTVLERNVGIHDVLHPMSGVEVRNVEAFEAVSPLLPAWMSTR